MTWLRDFSTTTGQCRCQRKTDWVVTRPSNAGLLLTIPHSIDVPRTHKDTPNESRCTMKKHYSPAILVLMSAWLPCLLAEERPYITTKKPITLLSANDGETDVMWRKTPEGLIDYEIKTKDSFTVIRLGPDHPPICKTVYGTVPCSIAGTPTMAMSADGRYGLITNHGFRPEAWGPITYPEGEPLTNDDIRGSDLTKQEMAPQRSDMISLIDLSTPEFKVVDRVLFDDHPVHVLAHPDKKHFIVGAFKNFYVFKIENGKLVEVSRSLHDKGGPCFWITPAGDRILATQGDWDAVDRPCCHSLLLLSPNAVTHLHEVKVLEGIDTRLTPDSYILRVSLDGRMALVCQRSMGDAGDLCDVLVVDLTKNPPVVNSVIKQVGDGVESFAFHPNGKMAVVTCLSKFNNSIAVLDIQSSPPRVLYYLDTGGCAQGIEFTPEGDKLFVGSAFTNRIEVFDVVGDFSLRKDPRFLKTGHGHCSLTIGKTWQD